MPPQPHENHRPGKRQPETLIVTGVMPEDRSPGQVVRYFRALLDGGAELKPAGQARDDPEILLTSRYLPRHEVALFDATLLLTDYLFDDALGFMVGFVVLQEPSGKPARHIHPRIIYKDSSLVWRVASHFLHDHEEYWIGKGAVRWERRDDGEYLCSVEETTNLPYELQGALDTVSRSKPKRRDDDAIELVLREGPSGRIEPYADFVAPRRRAAARYRINGGRRVAYFKRRGDPSSLRFVRGYEPDFARGVLEESASTSRYFGGALRKFRILSTNCTIQYLFISSPTHVWVNPPQTLTTELSTYAVRTLDVLADEDIFIPAYEYHDVDDDPADSRSQIPAGFAGAQHSDDPARADASAWIEALPVIREFRARVLDRE